MNKTFAIAALVVIFVAAIAIGVLRINPQEEQPTLYSITKDGVEYVFSNNIYDALKVPIENKDVIYENLALATKVTILFTNSTDNSYVAMAGTEIASKLSKYYAYTQSRIVNISGIELSDVSNETVQDVLIEFRTSATGANDTSVFLADNRIIIQALNATKLTLATDRLALVLFEDDLRSAGLQIPE